MSLLKFPQGFLWGAATSAHQIEGDNHNDWSEWEQTRPPEFRSGKACDSYNRFEEDFDIAKELNHNVHRLSFEWSRIEPEEGQFNQEAIEHYKKVIDAIRARGMEPMVTLWHFTNPVWFAEKGGFINKKSSEYFTRYVNHVVDNFKDRVGMWVVFNEPTSVYSGMSHWLGIWPPHYKSLWKYFKSQNNFIRCHKLAYQAIKKIYADVSRHDTTPHGASHNMIPLVGAVENFSFIVIGHIWRVLGVEFIINYFRNTRFWSKTSAYYDFLGLNYYTIRRLAGSSAVLAKQTIADEMQWKIYPKGIYFALKAIHKFNKPIYITENGIADRTDQKRFPFIKEHLSWVHKAIEEGADVRGYLYWSLLDNFEWHHGFGPRFGLVEVDYDSFRRTIRPSAYEYAKIIKDNALEY